MADRQDDLAQLFAGSPGRRVRLPAPDWGLSVRDIEHRLVVTGMIQLPLDLQISGILNYQSGRPYTPVDNGVDFRYCSPVGWNCPDYRAVMDGLVVGRNTERNESIQTIDLRVGASRRSETGSASRLSSFGSGRGAQGRGTEWHGASQPRGGVVLVRRLDEAPQRAGTPPCRTLGGMIL